MNDLFTFYSKLGFNLSRNSEEYFTGNLINKDNGVDLSVIHTGETHRLNCELNGMFCQIIPNSKININEVKFVKEVLSRSNFLKSNFPNTFLQILLLNTEIAE